MVAIPDEEAFGEVDRVRDSISDPDDASVGLADDQVDASNVEGKTEIEDNDGSVVLCAGVKDRTAALAVDTSFDGANDDSTEG